jgi:2,5-diamino-6-(ribosylamino)-4(3H)-pyrimidinone 5'-phosphate reductase
MNRPHILVNAAVSADGKMDSVARKGITISSASDKSRVDQLRASTDAILVGGRTLLAEDPKLTVKSPALRAERTVQGLEENPVKVGVVSLADLKLDGNFLNAGPARRLVYTTSRTTPEQIARLENAGAQVFVIGKLRVDLSSVLESLYRQGICKLMVEGGGTIIAEFFRLGLVDELTLYIAPYIFGGASAPTLVDGPGFLASQATSLSLDFLEKFDDEGGILVHYTVKTKGVKNGSDPHAN